MKTFENIKNKSFSFSSCEGCGAKCCSGLYGSNTSELLLEDFENVHKDFAILFSFGDLKYLKANIILSKNYEHCEYIKDNICTIYDKRPRVCATYPLSPNITNDIFIDISCPALIEGKDMVNEGILNNSFSNEIFTSYSDKFIETHFYLEKFNIKEDFEMVLNIKGQLFYKYIKDTSDKFMLFHQNSLKNL